MRELKFRAFDRKTGLFGTVIELSYSPNRNEEYVPSYVRVHDYSDVTHVAHYPESVVIQENLIIEQFTGLHDKNGKEIYEGDIVEWGVFAVTGYIKAEPHTKLVTAKREYSFSDFTRQEVEAYLSVIGNIHENPGLSEKAGLE